MRIQTDFSLPLRPDAAYELLLDLDRVAWCMPGAELGGARPDGARDLNLSVRLGPMRFAYRGTIEVVTQEVSSRRAVLHGKAREATGQGNAEAEIAMTVSEDGAAGSAVSVVSDITLTGRAGQMGQGVVHGVAKQLLREMTQCLETSIAQEGAVGPATAAEDRGDGAKPQARSLSGFRLLWAALRGWLRRGLRRGAERR